MVIPLFHSIHGAKVAISESEAIQDEKNGWYRERFVVAKQDSGNEESIEALRSKYELKFGKKPHHRKTLDTLRQELSL